MNDKLRRFLPNLQNLKMTAIINGFSALQIPLLAFITPRVVELTDTRAEVRVRLDRRSRNHLAVMYFGALSMGAELSIALKALQAIAASGERIDFIFKDFAAQFLKRADGHVHFACEQAADVQMLISECAACETRLERTFEGYAFVPEKSREPVMTYQLTLSVRRRQRR